MLAPNGFEQTLSAELYEKGQRVAAAKQGTLRYTTPMTVLSAALLLYGLRALQTAVAQQTMLSMWLSAAGILLAAGVILVLWLIVFPRRAKQAANHAYPMYRALYGKTTVSFTQDEMTLAGETLTRRVAFAKTRLCVETADLFVIFTDDGSLVLLEKAAFADKENTAVFLRDVFARWYKKG